VTPEQMADVFDRKSDEYPHFDRVINRRSRRPDMHAMMVLDGMFPGTTDMVSGASHDEFVLSIDVEELAAVATEELIVDLIRCGVRYDTACDALGFFT